MRNGEKRDIGRICLIGQRRFGQIADNKDHMKGMVGKTKPDLMSFTIDCDILCRSRFHKSLIGSLDMASFDS